MAKDALSSLKSETSTLLVTMSLSVLQLKKKQRLKSEIAAQSATV